MNNVTIFKDTWASTGTETNIFTVLGAIKNGHWKDKIEGIRKLSKEEYKESKKHLPGVTFSGIFELRKAAAIRSYSNVIVIDLDNVEDIDSLKAKLAVDEYVMSYFVSPSGAGLKILIQVSNPVERHLDAALQLEEYFLKKYNVKVDASGKDVCRLCYVSHDPDLHLKQALVFPVLHKEEINRVLAERDPTKGPPTDDPYYIYQVCKKWVDAKFSFVPGQRNAYRHALACALNRCGISKSESIHLIEMNLPPADNNAWHQSVNSAYSNRGEHGSVIVYDYEKKEWEKENKVFESAEYDTAELEFINHTLTLIRKGVEWRVINNLMGYYMYRRNVSDKLIAVANDIFIKEKESSIASSAQALESYEDEIYQSFMGVNSVKSYIESVDECFGGFSPGNLYCLAGCEATFKSIFVINICLENAIRGIETIYLNMEMSTGQFYARIGLMITGIDVEAEQKAGTLTKSIFEHVMNEVKKTLNGKLIVISKVGVSCQEITQIVLDRKSAGHKPELVIIDGMSHLHQCKSEEAFSNIENSKLLKESAKEADIPIVFLSHTTTGVLQHERNPINHCRGGQKIRGNLDGYMGNSLVIDAERSTFEHGSPDIIYRKRMVYSRVHNKRGNGRLIDCVFQLNDNLRLVPMTEPPRSFEVEIKSKR